MDADDMGTLFTTVAQGIDPDLTALTGPAIRRGRRMRRRRRALLSAVSVASAVAVTAAVTAGMQLWPGRLAGAGPAPASRSHLAHRSRPAVAVRKLHKPIPQAHGPGMTSKQMVAVLRHLLPAGAVLTDVVPISRGEIQVSYDDGHGPVTLSVTANLSTRLYPAQTADLARQCPASLQPDAVRRAAGAPPPSCVLHTLADGTLERLTVTPDDQWGLWNYDVMDFRPDGIEVEIVALNGIVPLGVGSRHADRPMPPGSLASWAALAESPAWHL